ncbi:MAG: SpoIID/LytB domain-containing protein [Syntrophobacterales bacterium]|nr:SpoIID/LytB domain-containing protein [Syntrophobacterales bacterium]
MATGETTIRVGVLDGRREIGGCFHGNFRTDAGEVLTGPFLFTAGSRLAPVDSDRRPPADGGISHRTREGNRVLPPGEHRFTPEGQAFFSLDEVTIGVNFHWERREGQSFQGALVVFAGMDGTLTAVNEIDREDYLASVISSEMAATAPREFLKAHAVIARSWLMAMLEKKKTVPAGAADRGGVASAGGQGAAEQEDATGEIIRWYGREEHDRFDVCADDHCQRYQGMTKIISEEARRAVDATRGLVLVYNGRICDTRYHKACGGRTEAFANVWEEVTVPYLISVTDGPGSLPPVTGEAAAAVWIAGRPDAYCNPEDVSILPRILPDFDQETRDFFRWEVSYDREELESLLQRRAGLDFGELRALIPLNRGPSGRIIRLKIEGSQRTVIVGKELEIRRWLSPSHLYSSAFVVETEREGTGKVVRFKLRGAGWGHGVGLCQIGAAMMALRGFPMEAILRHYFPGTTLRQIT